MSFNRILLVGPFPPIYSYGGPTKSIYGIYNLFYTKGFQCKVLSPKKNLDGSNVIIELDNKNIFYTNNFYLEFFKSINKVDIVWFNSFFEFKLLILIVLSKILRFKLIISPRGQLSDNAIETSNKHLKLILIKIVKVFKKNLNFHSTSMDESFDINNKLKTNNVTYLSNLFNLKFIKNNQNRSKYVFFSRIHKKKGLYFLLKTLHDNNINIDLDVYGFIEDKNYWKKWCHCSYKWQCCSFKCNTCTYQSTFHCNCSCC